MACCYGQSYILNENFGFERRKKDKSFKSFITFLLVVLVVYLVIYYVILTVIQRKTSDLETPATDSANYDALFYSDDAVFAKTTSDVSSNPVDSYKEYIMTNEETSTTIKENNKKNNAEKPKTENPFTNHVVDGTTTHVVEITTTDSIKNYVETTSNTIGNYETTESSSNSKETQQVDEKAVTDPLTILMTSNQFTATSTETIIAETTSVSNTNPVTNLMKTDQPTAAGTETVETETTSLHNLDPTTNLMKTNQFTAANTKTVKTETPLIRNEDGQNGVTTKNNIAKITEQPNYNIKLKQNVVKPPENATICQHPQCKATAAKMLSIMDHSADPCEDFYRFSCGMAEQSTSSTKTPKTELLLKVLYSKTSATNPQLQQFKGFFDGCVQYHDQYRYVSKARQVLSGNVDSANLTTLLAFLMLRQSMPLFDVNYGFISHEQGYGLQVLPPTSLYGNVVLKDWSLQDRIRQKCSHVNDILKLEEGAQLEDVYRTCLNDTFRGLVEEVGDVMQGGAGKRWDDFMVEFLTFILNLKKPTEIDIHEALLNKKYTETHIVTLQKKYPNIEWLLLFSKLIRSNFNQSVPVYLYLEEQYFENLMEELNERLSENEDTTLNVLKFYYQLELFKNLMTPKENSRRFCADQAASLMPEIAEKLFLEKSGISGESANFGSIFEELKDQFYWLVDMSLLEENLKSIAKEIVKDLKLSFFEKQVENINLNLTNDYLSNFLILLEDRRRLFLRQPTALAYQNDRFPTAIPNTHLIAIPNSFVYESLSAKENPSYVREAYIKFHLGRAIALYLHREMREWYSLFYTQFQKSLNGYLETVQIKASTGDRMADNLALQVTFQNTFPLGPDVKVLPWIPNDYTPGKHFFILIAQEFCDSRTSSEFAGGLHETPKLPGAFRVDSLISNSGSFKDVFGCARGSRMNPEEKTEFDSFDSFDNYYEQINK